MAKEAGWGWLTEKKSSAGICFIGKRNFSRSVDKYIPPTAGHSRSPDGTVLGMHTTHTSHTSHTTHDTIHATHAFQSGAFVGEVCAGKHEGMTKYTIGQRARIPGRVDANKYGPPPIVFHPKRVH
jgi:tRNA U34 2-thiouridine synthase MnmA/TrmU